MSVTAAPTTFWREIDRNRRRSWLLVGVVIVLFGLLGGAIGAATETGWGGLVVAVVVAGAMSVGAYFAGDRLVLLSSRAKPVEVANPPDRYKQLVNVVTEMKLASGLPMPKVYVIDDSAPNAFATGRDPRHASIAVTTGLLDKMSREELQGVIGHELSHIGNFDIRFALLVGVLVGAIALLSDWFLRWGFWGGGRRRGGGRDGGGGGAAILFALAILLAILAPLASRLVQLSVSRRRESLADVSAVELTRYSTIRTGASAGPRTWSRLGSTDGSRSSSGSAFVARNRARRPVGTTSSARKIVMPSVAARSEAARIPTLASVSCSPS